MLHGAAILGERATDSQMMAEILPKTNQARLPLPELTGFFFFFLPKINFKLSSETLNFGKLVSANASHTQDIPDEVGGFSDRGP